MKHDFTHLVRPSKMALAASLAAALAGGLATTYNYKGGVSAGSAAGLAYAPGAVNVQQIKLDFSDIATDRSAAGQAALAAADVLELFTVKAGTWVPAAFIQATTAEGAAATVQLGDGADPNGFIDSSSINTTGWYSSLVTTAYSVAVGGGKLYTADDTVDLTLDHNSIDTAVIYVTIVSVDARAVRS